MKRYQFPLAAVLRVRRIEEERARGELLDANRAVQRLQALLRDREAAYRDAYPEGATDAASLAAARVAAEHRARAVLATREALGHARRHAEERRLAWTRAATAVRALERLQERGRAAHAIAAARLETSETDDLVSARFGRLR